MRTAVLIPLILFLATSESAKSHLLNSVDRTSQLAILPQDSNLDVESPSSQFEMASILGSKKLRIKVVDQNGVPLAGTKVTGNQSKPTRQWTTKYYPFEGETDSKGQYSIPVSKFYVGLTVVAPGYYPASLSFKREHVPKQEQIIVLEQEDEPVLLYKSKNTIRHRWEDLSGEMAFGIQFPTGPPLSGGEKIVFSKEEADIWISITKTRETVLGEWANPKNDKAWIIDITGGDNWEVLAGPAVEKVSKPIRRTPIEGYKKMVTIQGGRQLSSTIFLRAGNGARYGRLSQLSLADESSITKTDLVIGFKYEVQAENTYSNSLNPDWDKATHLRWKNSFEN